MGNTSNTEYGQIIISEDVIADIVGIAAIECYGIVGMASKRFKDGIWELLKRENLSKGVVIKSSGEKLIVDVFIIVSYGVNISQVCQNIMDKVKYTLETNTGLEVDEVNINVQGIRVEE
ncbi:Asp23/Gls24 family envelope stress response protein [Natranaerofaba carboxydovora]|uniref:Asp23/Gls24 family envelope stress response protein n=1 Tax=Natranaerofaba carboxydovora TaxID=2742683 RepID=UPI001F12EAF6|nr:Asp23/Gls24 family envelope stress response protein [Natranaerofaba carboxydovora]UMZ73308.1 Asp23 family, cell envelope-related function [Natranaerofaba carboxydovora]